MMLYSTHTLDCGVIYYLYGRKDDFLCSAHEGEFSTSILLNVFKNT